MSLSGSSDSRCRMRDDEVRDLVVDRRAEKDDALGEQARVDVEGTLAARGLLDHHRDQRAHPRSLPAITGCGVAVSVRWRRGRWAGLGGDPRNRSTSPTDARTRPRDGDTSLVIRQDAVLTAVPQPRRYPRLRLAGKLRRPSGTSLTQENRRDPSAWPPSPRMRLPVLALAALTLVAVCSQRGSDAAGPGEQAGAGGSAGDHEQTRAGVEGARADACDRRALTRSRSATTVPGSR